MAPCRQATFASRGLDDELAQGFPAGDPPLLTQQYDDASDAAGCGYSNEAEKACQSARWARWQGCRGGKGVDDGS